MHIIGESYRRARASDTELAVSVIGKTHGQSRDCQEKHRYRHQRDQHDGAGHYVPLLVFNDFSKYHFKLEGQYFLFDLIAAAYVGYQISFIVVLPYPPFSR